MYALTDEGRHELQDWLRELVEDPQHEYPHFVAALSLIATLPPTEVLDLLAVRSRRLAEQRAATRDLIDETLAKGVHPLFLIEGEYRVAMLDAEIAFVELFGDRITDPKDGWQGSWAAFHAAGRK